MSGPPPGQNPNDSLLEGGTATIAPVMGGGGDNNRVQPLPVNVVVPAEGGQAKPSVGTVRAAMAARAAAKATGKKSVAFANTMGKPLTQVKSIPARGNVKEEPDDGDPDVTAQFQEIVTRAKTVTTEKEIKAILLALGEIPVDLLSAQNVTKHKRLTSKLYRTLESLPSTNTTKPPSSLLGRDLSGAPAAEGLHTKFELYTVSSSGQAHNQADQIRFLRDVQSDLDTEEWKQEMVRMIKEQQAVQTKLWNRKLTSDNSSQTAQIPQYSKCAVVDADASKGVQSKRVQFLPPTLEKLVILPPVRGNLQRLVTFLEWIWENDLFDKTSGRQFRLKKGVHVVAMAPFFDSSSEGSKGAGEFFDGIQSLLWIFLRMTLQNPSQFSVLAEHTPSNMVIGCAFYQKFPGLPEDFLLNFLQPSQVVQPQAIESKSGLILTSSEPALEPSVPISKNSNFHSVSSQIKKGLFKEDPNLAIQPHLSEKDVEFENQAIFCGAGAPTRFGVPVKKPNPKGCPELLGAFRLEGIEMPIQFTHTNEIVLFSTQEGEKDTKALCAQDTTQRPKEPKEILAASQKFVAAPDSELELESVHRIHVRTQGNSFTLRVPERENLVMENWKRLLFTQSEADFLNELHLRPRILEQVFPEVEGGNWKEELARFLKNTVSSNCFNDLTILTKKECQTTRLFLRRVFDQMVLHNISMESIHQDDIDEELRLQFQTRREEAKKELRAELQKDLEARREKRAEARKAALAEGKPLPSELDEEEKEDEAILSEIGKDTPGTPTVEVGAPGDLMDLKGIQFQAGKHRWNDIEWQMDVFHENIVMNIIMVNQKTKAQSFKRIKIPRMSVEKGKEEVAFRNKIEEYRVKFPNYIFIY